MLILRQTAHGAQRRTCFHNRGKTAQDADGWQKKSVVADSPTLSAAQLEVSSVHIGDHCISVENYHRCGSYHEARLDEQSVQTMSGPSNSQAQVMHNPFLSLPKKMYNPFLYLLSSVYLRLNML